jgi:hypothetical protein
MPLVPDPPLPDPAAPHDAPATDRRTGATSPAQRRVAVHRYLARHRLLEFHRALAGLANTVFGPQATVAAHLRTMGGRARLAFVVDAADPSACVQYEAFIPYEQAFWTAYAQLPKPDHANFVVAIRPARGWSRVEALAPLFSWFPVVDDLT